VLLASSAAELVLRQHPKRVYNEHWYGEHHTDPLLLYKNKELESYEQSRKQRMDMVGRVSTQLVFVMVLSTVIAACALRGDVTPAAHNRPVAPGATPPVPPVPRVVLQPTAQITGPFDQQQAQTAATPISACTFASSAKSEPQVPALDTYRFSEPAVILTAQLIGISQWLPDSQRLLLARSSSADQQDVFETLDVQTRATQRYGGQAGRRTKPVWLDAEQAVAFTEVRSNTEVVLRIGRETGAPAEDAVTDLRSPYLAISADGQQVAFMSQVNRGQRRALTVRQGRQVRALIGAMPTAEQASVQLDEWQALRAAWRPDGKQIAFYNKTSFSLTDTTTGEVCSVDLGGDSSGRRWALKANWSPDGRFLAALTSIGGVKGQVPFVDITVLDTATGTLRYLTLDVQHIYEFAWLPTGRQIAALGQLDRVSAYANPSLFLADVRTGDFQLHHHSSASSIAEECHRRHKPDAQRERTRFHRTLHALFVRLSIGKHLNKRYIDSEAALGLNICGNRERDSCLIRLICSQV
jgi:hypothetical protein